MSVRQQRQTRVIEVNDTVTEHSQVTCVTLAVGQPDTILDGLSVSHVAQHLKHPSSELIGWFISPERSLYLSLNHIIVYLLPRPTVEPEKLAL